MHITFGDYTPRQRTVGYLESYRARRHDDRDFGASEVHVPGRPRDVGGREGARGRGAALLRGLPARRHEGDGRFGHPRTGLARTAISSNSPQKGVRLAKAGFGAVKTAYDYVPLVAAARAAGLITTCRTGGSSIPGSGAITGDHLLKMHPHVSFHINGGPTAMPDADFERVITRERDRPAGLHRRKPAHHAAVRQARGPARRVRPFHHRDRYAHRQRHHAARHALHHRAPREPHRHAARALHLRSLGEQCARLQPGLLGCSRPAKRADIVLIDAPDGGTQQTALAAIKHGDIAAIGAVVTAGVPRFVGRSRNTPATTRKARVAVSRISAGFRRRRTLKEPKLRCL